MSFFKDEINYKLLDLIKKDFFNQFESFIGINLKPSNNSNKIIDNKLMLMTWAGPTADVYNLFHEMGHLLEIDEARCHLPDWGLKIPPLKFAGGHTYRDNLTTPQAIEREIRVFGIQTIFHRHYGYEYDCDDSPTLEHYHAQVCKFIDGLHFFYPEGWMLESAGYSANEAYAMEKIRQLIVDESKKWSFDNLRELWYNRMDILRQKQLQGCWNYED